MKTLAVVLLAIILTGCVHPDAPPVEEKVKRKAIYISEAYNRHVVETMQRCHNEAFKISYEMWLGGATEVQSEIAYTKVNQMCLMSKKMFI